MLLFFRRSDALTGTAALALAACLAGCGGQSGASLPSQGGAAFAPQTLIPKSGPPSCKGQTETTVYATAPGKFHWKLNRTLCIPSFGGFGGTMTYPSAKPPLALTVTSSTTDYNESFPTFAKGKVLFYLQMTTARSTVFGTKVPAKGGLTGNIFKVGKAYTVYGEAKLFGVAGITIPFTPCNAVGVAGKYGTVIRGMGSLLANQSIGGGGNYYFEVFAGKHAKVSCPST